VTPIHIALVGAVVFATHAIEAVTGFGCTVLALPFVTAVLGVRTGVPLLAILGWILALYIAITKRRSIDFKQYLLITAFVGLGLPFGMYAFRALDPFWLKKALAVFIIATSIWRLLRGFKLRRTANCPAAPERKMPKAIAFPLLVLGGVIHGAFASGGPLIVLYAAAALPDKGRFRATLCLMWTTLNTVLIVSYAVSGIFVADFNKGLAAMAPFLLAGIVVGEKIHDKMDPVLFSQVVFGVLAVTGVIMLVL